jgi:hypothetical protein
MVRPAREQCQPASGVRDRPSGRLCHRQRNLGVRDFATQPDRAIIAWALHM